MNFLSNRFSSSSKKHRTIHEIFQGSVKCNEFFCIAPDLSHFFPTFSFMLCILFSKRLQCTAVWENLKRWMSKVEHHDLFKAVFLCHFLHCIARENLNARYEKGKVIFFLFIVCDKLRALNSCILIGIFFFFFAALKFFESYWEKILILEILF